jgi:hypothetical protein
VALLGESVARGYLFDPLVNPATMLQEMLDSELPQGYQVIDLARTDATFEHLEILAQQLPLLKPQIVILFAGNNWHKFEPSISEFQMLAHTLRETHSFAAVAQVYRESLMPRHAKRVINLLAEVCHRTKAQQLNIIPEFNLTDWQSECPVLVPFLVGKARPQWLKHRSDALQFLREGRLPEARALAEDMMRLDLGASWLAPWILGQVSLFEQDYGAAQCHLEKAKDSVCGMFVPHSPRCATSIQSLLRAHSSQCSLGVVDLPHEFRTAPGTSVANREVFLDYCHLNARGMKLAMGRVAEKLLAIEPKSSRCSAPELSSRVNIPTNLEGEAHFLAAIHNAHYGQEAEIVRFHFSTALQLCPSLSHVALAYLDFQGREAPSWLCRSFARLGSSAVIHRYFWPTDAAIIDKFEDSMLEGIFLTELEKREVRHAEQVRRVLLSEHGAKFPINLLSHFSHARTFRSKFGYSTAREHAFYRSYLPESRFRLIAAGDSDLLARIVFRIPSSAAPNATARILLNDTDVCCLAGSAEWRTFPFKLHKEHLREGTNVISLHWPMPQTEDGQEIERAARQLEFCAKPEVLPTYGDISLLMIISQV